MPIKISRYIGFWLFLFSVSLLDGYGLPSAFGQGVSRLDSEVPNRARINSETRPDSLRPTLKSGSRGAMVSELQRVLKRLGYYGGEVDGTYGRSTAIAVSRFQEAAGLNVDGIVGTATWERLFPPTAQTSPSSTTTTEFTDRDRLPPTRLRAANSPPATVAESPSADLPTLKLGTRGAEVFWLQKRLQTIGFFSGVVDGVFNADTELAVKAAQRNYGINADGVVGSNTWRVLLP